MRTDLDGGFALADAERHGDEAFYLRDSDAPARSGEAGTCPMPPGLDTLLAQNENAIRRGDPTSGEIGSRAADEAAIQPFARSLDGVALLDPRGLVVAANPRGRAMQGAVGASWIEGWSLPESRAAADAALALARGGEPARFRAAEGPSWWDVALTPVAGPPARILTVARDISEPKQAEARQGVLLMEMEHRLKNTLAIVQAVATQTLRNAPSLGAAAESLGARMLALAQAHDVLMQGAWASASLRGLVDGAVRLHGDGTPERFQITGPEVTIGPRPALTLALMLHELGTNAAKYGALSNDSGRVRVGWRIAGAAGQEWLWFRWAEHGGPRVVPPTRTGFGSRLIERSLVHSFGGSARLRYPPEGAVLALTAPLAAVTADPQAP